MIKALIFDFDGLIIDTETPDYQSWAEVYGEHGLILPRDLWTTLIGGHGNFNPYEYLENQIGHEVNRVELREKRQARYKLLAEQKPILPGVQRMLLTAKRRGMKLGVASNSFGKWVNGHLKRLGLSQFFDVVVTLDMITIGKPEPKMYLSTLLMMDVLPHEAIAFEDSPAGAMGAKRAGIFTVAIPNEMTKDLDFSHCDRVVSSMGLLDLDSLIEQVGKEVDNV